MESPVYKPTIIIQKLVVTILMVLIVAIVATVSASAVSLNFLPLTSADGLSDQVVNKIYKDSRGYVWLGTGLALDRFDGVRIKSVPIPGENLNQKRVRAILEYDGNIYMGNADGLYRLDRSTMTLERVFADKIRVSVNALAVAGGSLFIATESGLFQCNKAGKLRRYLLSADAMSSSNEITAMIAAGDSTLWIGAAKNLHRFNIKTARFDNYPAPQLYSITSLVIHDNSLYVGTYGGGIGVFNLTSLKFVDTLGAGNNIVTALAVDSEQRLLVATDGDGILVYAAGSSELIRHLRYESNQQSVLRSNSVYSLYVDNLSLLWVGYYQDGADYTPNRQDIFDVYSYPGFIDTRRHAVRAVAIDGHRKVIGTREGLFYVDESTGQRAYFTTPQIRSNIIFCIEKVDGQYYVGTYNGGMYRLNPQSLTLSDFKQGKYDFGNESVFCVCEDAAGDVWIGTSKGVYRYRGDKEVAHYTHANSQLPSGNVYEIYFDSTGRGWMCTEHGMAIYNGVELRADGFPQGFANKEKVRAILEDSDHELWFVPDRGNLFRSNLQLTEFSSITQQFAINSRAMTFIIEDSEGMLWIGSESGLARYDKKETMSYFNGSNGLPNKVFTLCPPVRDSNGDLWMGNNRGLVKLDFERFRRLPKLKSLPVLTDLECNGHSIFDRVKVGKTSYVVRLTGDENNLAVSYANFDYKDPEDLIVEYYLEGRETEWHVNSGKNQIRYFDLPKGKYRLHLRQGGDSTSETVIDIRIDRKVDVAMVVMVLLLLFTGGFAAYFCYKHLYLSRVMAAQDATLARERQEASDAAEAEKLKRYQTARLSDEECKRLFKKLEAVMKQQRPYTNPDLKSSELAAMIGTTSHGLSFLFNQWLNKNFYDYVNEYRVEAFKRLVMEEGANKYTLTAMSQMCGFSSRASFFRHFKQITGVTPADWIASLSR